MDFLSGGGVLSQYTDVTLQPENYLARTKSLIFAFGVDGAQWAIFDIIKTWIPYLAKVLFSQFLWSIYYLFSCVILICNAHPSLRLLSSMLGRILPFSGSPKASSHLPIWPCGHLKNWLHIVRHTFHQESRSMYPPLRSELGDYFNQKRPTDFYVTSKAKLWRAMQVPRCSPEHLLLEICFTT